MKRLREALAVPAGLAAIGVLLLRAFLAWIFTLPARIIKKLDALYYWFVQLGRRIAGESIWRPGDYEHLHIDPPGGWAKISPEHREQMEADNWVFSSPSMPPWKCAAVPQPPVDGDEPVLGFDPDEREDKEPTP